MITYFGGPEGAGKSALMTYHLRKHHLMKGEVWAFPGYELKNDRGRVVSTLVNPSDVISMIDDMQYIVLVIDEIGNFINHHSWQNALNDVLSYGLMAQRRKRQFVILASGPFFKELPPDIAHYFHVYYSCQDKHWKNHKLERGEQIRFTETDLRGVLSGRPYTTTRPQVFRPKRYYKYYDTFAIVDPKYQHLKVKVRKDVVEVDSDGNIIKKVEPKTITNHINEFIKMTGDTMEIKKYDLNNYIAFKLGKDDLDYGELLIVGRIMGAKGYGGRNRRPVWRRSDE